MALPKGHPKYGGRQRGTKNKRTLAEEACHKLGVNPFEMLAQKCLEGSENAIIQLCKHIEPPRKAIEVGLDPEHNTIKIIVEEFKK
jgi:hypothetical protein